MLILRHCSNNSKYYICTHVYLKLAINAKKGNYLHFANKTPSTNVNGKDLRKPVKINSVYLARDFHAWHLK